MKFENTNRISKKINLESATVGLVTIKKDVISSPDFLAGKAGDTAAADRIVDQVWSNKKTDQLREHLFENSVFLTMPSTTGTNIIPIQLAQFLSRKTNHPWVSGDEIFDAKHTIASKEISRNKRLFQNRKFEIIDQEPTDILQDFKVVIVDDIITTGGSIRAFLEFLRDEKKMSVDHVVGLMGDRRFEIDKKTEDKLRTLLKEKHTGIEFESISYLTRTEAGGLIRSLNSARTENAIQKLADQLQGISRCRVTSDPERTPGSDRNKNVGKKDSDNATTSERIPNYTSASSNQGCTWEIEFFQNGQQIKKKKLLCPVS